MISPNRIPTTLPAYYKPARAGYTKQGFFMKAHFCTVCKCKSDKKHNLSLETESRS